MMDVLPLLLSSLLSSVKNDHVLCIELKEEEEEGKEGKEGKMINNEQAIIQLNQSNVYMSTGLWKHLNFEKQSSSFPPSSSSPSLSSPFSSNTPSPSFPSFQECNGEVKNIKSTTNGEISATCIIQNNAGERVSFGAIGKLVLNKIFIFSLFPSSSFISPPISDATDPIVLRLFDKTRLPLGVVAIENETEWTLVWVNSFVGDSKLIENGILSDPSARSAIYDCCSKSQFSRTYEVVTIGRPPLVRLYISYLGRMKEYDNKPLFSFVGYEIVEEQNILTKDIEAYFQKAPVVMGIVDLIEDNWRIVRLNEMAAKTFSDMQKAAIFEDTKYHQIFVNLYKKSLTTTNPVCSEVEYPYPVGETSIYYCVISCLSIGSNGVSRHAFELNDITQQRKAERELEKCKQALEESFRLELRESEDRFRSLVTSAPSIIMTVDTLGFILFSNRKITDIDVVGQNIDTVFVDGTALLGKIQNVFVSNNSFQLEVRLIGKDMWFSISVAKVNEKLAIVIATDVTEMKQLSEDLRRAVSAKSRFLANMSHEIRTPLSGIIGMSRMLAETGLSIDQADCVSTIQQCGETLLSVINDVLDYTKLEATGGMEIVIQPFSLQQILEESLYTVLPLAEKKGIEMILDIEPGTPDWIMGDSMRLRQIVVNLLNNSTKFTSTGYIQLSLSSERISGNSYTFKFNVKDTGCGISPDNQSKLFQMFYQVDNSTTRRFGGTGIGLALARKFAEFMGGKIWVESMGKDGCGSTFYFTMTADTATSTPPPCSLTAYSLSLLTPLTAVVIVDKSDVSRRALERRLRHKGFTNITGYSTIDDFKVDNFHQVSHIVCFLDTDCHYSDLPQTDSPMIAYIFMGTKRPEISPTESPSVSEHNSPLLPKLSFSSDSLHSSSSTLSSSSSSSSLGSFSMSRSNSFSSNSFSSRSRSGSITSFPSIFDFARKPLKDSAICRCINYISLQFYHCSNTPKSPPLAPTQSRNNSFVVYPLEVMVVEDNEINQRVIRRMLQQIGYATIAVANNGKEALDHIDEFGLPDIIFMDIQMPVLDGVECTKVLRQKYESWPYIVALTADAFPEDRVKCMHAGMNDFLTKPIRLEHLQGSLETCFTTKLKAFHHLLPPTLALSE